MGTEPGGAISSEGVSQVCGTKLGGYVGHSGAVGRAMISILHVWRREDSEAVFSRPDDRSQVGRKTPYAARRGLAKCFRECSK